MKRKLIYIVLAIAGAGVLVAATHPDLKLGRSIETLANIMRDVNLYYVDETEPEELLKGAAMGLTAGLDPYTEWMAADQVKDFEIMATGHYGGIGALIRRKGDHVAVAQPYEGSPADRAGLVPGDRFVSIDGVDVVGATTERVSGLLKGAPGTTFTAAVLKLMTGRTDTVEIMRERITLPAVPYYDVLDNGIGYIRHTDFSDGCSEQMRRAFTTLRTRGPLKGLILDYRDNGGGILQEAVEILSMFLPRGTEVVSTRGRREGTTSYRTMRDPIDTEVPIVVLVDNGSASAAEIVAGALQDLDRAVVIGQRTYGKGLVQQTRPVGYGSYLKITIAKYYTPSGRCIQSVADSTAQGEFTTLAGRKVYDGGGIMPDVRLEPEYISLFTALVYARGYIEEFCDDYIRENPDATSVPYENFVAWMADKEIEYESETRRALRLLRERAEREMLLGAIGDEIAAMEGRLKDDKNSSLQLYRDQLQEFMDDEMIMRRSYARGVVEHGLKDDREVAAAGELLRDGKRYGAILSSQDTERR